MPYLPELAAAVPPRFQPGVLARWLREALVDLDPIDQDRIFLRFELLYARRRAERRLVEPVPDLAKEAAWLIERLALEGKTLGYGVGAELKKIQGRVRRALRAWETGED